MTVDHALEDAGEPGMSSTQLCLASKNDLIFFDDDDTCETKPSGAVRQLLALLA